VIGTVWSDLIVVVVAAVLGWLGRTFVPTKRPPDKPPAPRKNG
jgi:hypothetical protein